MAQTIGVAIASSPLKLAQGATGLLGGGEEPGERQPPATISFAPGSADLSPEANGEIAQAVEELRSDKNAQMIVRHVLGKADLEIAHTRANPTAADAQDLALNLRRRKQELERERQELAIRTSVSLAAVPASSLSAELERIRQLDREIVATDEAMSSVLDLFRPGADRQDTRRTRAVTLGLGEARLQAVKSAIMASGIRDPEQRMQIAPANAQVGSEGESQVTIELATRKK